MTGGSVAPASHGTSTLSSTGGGPPGALPPNIRLANTAGAVMFMNPALPYHIIIPISSAATGAAATADVTIRNRCASR